MKLTIGFCTNRDKPQFQWFLDSLIPQVRDDDRIQVLAIASDNSRDISLIGAPSPTKFECHPAKPTVWSGASRLTKEDWWSKSNFLNTALCLGNHEYFCTMDDRSVILPGWLDAIRRQQESPFPYVLLGRYEKRVGMKVENGVITHGGKIVGVDSRFEYCEQHYEKRGMKPPFKAPGEWSYGCTICLPLEWALRVGGFEEEHCDGLSGEDYIFGKMLENNGYPLFYEPRMIMVEDRTPEECGPVAIRRDKGVSPKDKSHAALDKLKGLKHTLNKFDIRQLRHDALARKPWPPPSGSATDWFDNQPLSEMTAT